MAERAEGLLQVEPGCFPPNLGAVLDELVDAALDLHVGTQERDPLLRRADDDVIGRHVTEQRDEHVAVVGHRGIQLVVGRHDRPAEAPQVQFPIQPEAVVPVVEEPAGHGAGSGVDGHTAACVGAAGPLLLGEDLAHDDGPLGPGLEYPIAGFAEREILAVRTVNQLVEFRIVEYGPPAGEDFRVGLRANVRGVDPVLSHAGTRRLVVRSDLEAVVKILAHARAAGAQQQHEEDGRAVTAKMKWETTAL